MKVKIWGARGSIPSPLKPQEIKEKIYQAVLGTIKINLATPEAVRNYVDSLPVLLSGTAGGNTTCVEIQADNQTFIIDAGSGIRELGLKLMDGPCGRGEGVLHLLFSHAHWDHIQGFPFFRPAFVPGNKIYIYSIHDLKSVLADQQKFINFPVPLNYMQAAREFITIMPGQPFNIGDVRINTIETVHPGKAYAFRFDDDYSTFVFASDAEYKNLDKAHLQPYIDFFSNADALIFDTQFTLGEALERVDWGHSSALIGADMARAAGVKKLLLFHHDPTYSDAALRDIQKNTIKYQEQNSAAGPMCEVVVAYEGLTLDLTPAGSLSVELLHDTEAAVLTPTTIFDEQGVGRLELQLDRLQELNSSTGSVIDLSQVENLTTSSLKALMLLRRDHAQSSIVLASPSPHVRQVIELAGFLDFFAIYPSVEAALTALQTRESVNLPGQIIKERYQIEKKLHDGRLGAVLQATDLTRKRTVAIKLLSASFSQASLDRFLRQAEQLVNLQHINMVDVIDYGRTAGSAFIVEEFAPGQNLQEVLALCESHPMPPQEALDIGLQVARVLEYVHNRGKIHGDLQPKNVILMPTPVAKKPKPMPGTKPLGVDMRIPQGPVVKVKRFGIGWLEEGVALLEIPLALLSARYLAPEQILGHHLDARTDLYALGVILYELFTGQCPFDSGDDRETMRLHLHETPHSPRELNPQLSNALEHFILKLLAKNPNERYANAQQAYHILKSLVVHRDPWAGIDSPTPLPQHRRALVGRQQQLSQLIASWHEAQHGHGQLFFITGETGIGKTRLAQELALYAGGGVVLTGYCEEWEGAPAYHPFIEMLRSYFSTVPPELINQQNNELLGEMTRLLPEIGRLLPDVPKVTNMEPKQEQLRVMTTLTRFITQATKTRTWLIILEDLHWIDNSTLQMLAYLARYCPSMRLLIVCTYRDTDLDIKHPLLNMLRGLNRQPGYQVIPLERFERNEVGEMVASILEPDTLSTASGARLPSSMLIDRIYQRTEGNPVYVEEVVNGLVEDGVITYEAGHWELSNLADISHMPDTVRDAVLYRIKHLNSDTQQLLRQAAVLGRNFKFVDLQAVSGLSEWEVLERLDVALERQLVHEVPSQATAMLSFNHAEIQQVLYEDMSPLRRRALHLQAGRAIEAQRDAESVEQLAYHYGKAGKFEQAVLFAIEAARQAESRWGTASALHWYQRVLEMAMQAGPELRSPSGEFQSSVLVAKEAMGQLLGRLGRYDEGIEMLVAVRDFVENSEESGVLGPPTRRLKLAELSWKVARIYKKQGKFDMALKLVESGRLHLHEDEKCVELAMLYLLEAELFHDQANYDGAVTSANMGLEVATGLESRAGKQAVALACCLLGGSWCRLGDLKEAEMYCQQSLAGYEEIDDLEGCTWACINLGKVFIELGKWELARDVLLKSLSLKEEIGDGIDQGRVFSRLADIAVVHGDFDRANELYQKSLADWHEVGSPLFEAGELSNLAQIALLQKDWPTAENYLKQSEIILANVNSDKLLPKVELCWAEFYLGTNHLDEAMSHAQRSLELSIAHKDMLKQGVVYRTLGQIYQAKQEIDSARETLQKSLDILTSLSNDYEMARTMLALAQLKGPDTAALLAQANAIFERLGGKKVI
jgi:serine/threonine protein kinase/phosphoribosyl 1,2-cyclic phosphodiesterase/tetratricopeptide (TPR) repeat protein/anti-anti-sigma regulatory factor